MSELYDNLKREIQSRAVSRAKECVDSDDHNKVLRAQGATRELEQLVDIMERMEQPEPVKEQSEDIGA